MSPSENIRRRDLETIYEVEVYTLVSVYSQDDGRTKTDANFASDASHEKRMPMRTIRNRPKHLKLTHYIAPTGNGTFRGKEHSRHQGDAADAHKPNQPIPLGLRDDTKDSLAMVSSLDDRIQQNGSHGDVNIEFEASFERSNIPWSCHDISTIEITEDLGRGTTKQAFLGNYNGSEVCVKMVTSLVTDVRTCLRKPSLSNGQCFLLANYKLLKEIGLLLQLKHHSIIKMLGYCIRGEANTKNTADHGVVLVTEVGVKVTPYRMQKMSWPQRLQTVVDLASLFDYMHTSPLGSLRMGDFKQSQFMFVNGRIKLSDLDDVTSEERECQGDRDCRILSEPANVPCLNGFCSGINSKANLLLAAVELLQPLLKDVPPSVRDLTDKLLDDLNYKRLSAAQFKDETKRIVDTWRHYRRGPT